MFHSIKVSVYVVRLEVRNLHREIREYYKKTGK